MNENIISWYKVRGCKDINKQLLELVDRNIGQIPLVNLLPERFKNEQMFLLKELVNDGAKVEEVTYSDGTKELFILI